MHEQERDEGSDGGKRKIIVTAFGVWDATRGSRDDAALRSCREAVESLVQASSQDEYSVGNSTSLPLVFLLQNNPFLPDSTEDRFQVEVQQIQREVLDKGEDPSGGNIYLIHDRESIFSKMSCYRMGDSIHFWDPVKLVEGKMLWDLIALVAGAET